MPDNRMASFRQQHRTLLQCAALACLLLSWTPAARAQTATVSGFVTDAANGRALELVNVSLQGEDGVLEGTTTNPDGLFLIPRIAPGRYVLRASFVGYETYADTLQLSGGEVRTINIALSRQEEELDEVLVESERTSGAARVTAGRQTIRPTDIELVPTPDLSGDLASYLTTLPGIVSTGDRGGQLFIRGGEPSQNLVRLDGMTLYQPFHLLGFYSAFPADILNRTDVYAGGFGSKYGGRLSSVLDISTRSGNDRRFAGAVSLSPFISSVRLEGPVVPGRLSFLASARESLVEQGAERLVADELPFSFGDAFVKLHGVLTKNSRLAVTALRTHDRGTLVEDVGGVSPEEVRYENTGAGLRYLILPRILPVMMDLRLTHSRLQAELGPRGEPSRSSTIRDTRLALDATFYGDRVDVEAGWAVEFINLDNELGGFYQNIEGQGASLTPTSLYVEPDILLGGGLHLRPGVRLQFYSVRFDPYVEPRLRLVWERGVHQLSGATGLYHQEILGLSDRRDAASVFTAWTNIPKAGQRAGDVRTGRIARALHGIVGYRITPRSWLEFSIEGFYKNLTNLFISEWTAFPRFTTRLQPANGRSIGFEARMELHRGGFYSYINYGLSSTRYAAEQASLELWYGEETLEFRPPHDRRHQVNALVSTALYGFDVSARWEFGSGLPFSRALGFDGFALIDDIVDVSRIPRSRRVIYERPFNGLLPTYHRLDLAVERTFSVRAVDLTLQASVINAYDRRNLFYLDVFTLERVDQLPFVPSFGIKVAFE